jgi:hypothetical protein
MNVKRAGYVIPSVCIASKYLADFNIWYSENLVKKLLREFDFGS